jgi:hypothetical protein
MKILHVISSVDPRGGGPIEGIQHVAHRARRYYVQRFTVQAMAGVLRCALCDRRPQP